MLGPGRVPQYEPRSGWFFTLFVGWAPGILFLGDSEAAKRQPNDG